MRQAYVPGDAGETILNMLNPLRALSLTRSAAGIYFELRSIRKLLEAYLTAQHVDLPLSRAEHRKLERDLQREVPAPAIPSEEQLARAEAERILAARDRGEYVEGAGSEWNPLV